MHCEKYDKSRDAASFSSNVHTLQLKLKKGIYPILKLKLYDIVC